MAISSKFSVAAHILSLIAVSAQTKERISSEMIAGSVNTNPVVIRRIIGMLSKAGLLRTSPGVPGAELTRELREMTLLDVYRAVQAEREELFAMHERPNPACPVGRGIQGALDDVFLRAQRAMEAELAAVTMEEVCRRIVQEP